MSARSRRLARTLAWSCIFALNGAASVRAQVAGPDTTVAELHIEACDEEFHREIREAMDLEVDAGMSLTETPPLDGASVRFEVVAPCSEPSYVELRDDLIGLVVRRVVALDEFPAHLRPRMLALVAHELARLDRNARATRLSNSEPTVLLAPPAEAVDELAEQASPVVSAAPARPASDSSRDFERSTVPSRAVAVEIDAVSRVFVRSPVFLAGGRIGITFGRFETGFLLLGNRRGVQVGSVGILSTTLDVALRIFPSRPSHSPFSLRVRGETGLVRTQGRPDPIEGYSIQGNRSVTATAGGSLDAALIFAARDVDAAFRIDLEIGGMVGPRLNPSTGPWVDHTIVLSGLQTSLRIGALF